MSEWLDIWGVVVVGMLMGLFGMEYDFGVSYLVYVFYYGVG